MSTSPGLIETFNAAMLEAEMVLRELGLQYRAHVNMMVEGQGMTKLHWDKVDDTWCLCVPRVGVKVRVTSSPIRVRIAAAKSLVDLYKELDAKVGVDAAEIEAATKSIFDFVRSHSQPVVPRPRPHGDDNAAP
jgi:hypothetical protein